METGTPIRRTLGCCNAGCNAPRRNYEWQTSGSESVRCDRLSFVFLAGRCAGTANGDGVLAGL